jgi:hypothetical protein
MTVLIDPDMSVMALRQTLYDGNFVVLTRLKAVTEFVEHTRAQLTELFKPHDPERAHEHFDAAEMARMLGEWKPRFIHSPRSKNLVRAIVQEARFPASTTFYDVPKPRTAFPVGHLTTGIAFAFPWHRDLWYSAPSQQLNWWLPVFRLGENNSMGFDPLCFDQRVENSSDTFDYYRNNLDRAATATQVGREWQSRPAALDHTPVYELVVLPTPGSILLFSGAQLHRSVPNTSGRSRFSVDFRTVDVRDLRAGRGAPVVDVHCTGTAIRDFRNVGDDSALDEGLITRMFGAPPQDAMLVYSAPHSAVRV